MCLPGRVSDRSSLSRSHSALGQYPSNLFVPYQVGMFQGNMQSAGPCRYWVLCIRRQQTNKRLMRWLHWLDCRFQPNRGIDQLHLSNQHNILVRRVSVMNALIGSRSNLDLHLDRQMHRQMQILDCKSLPSRVSVMWPMQYLRSNLERLVFGTNVRIGSRSNQGLHPNKPMLW